MNKERTFSDMKTYDTSYETSGKGKTRKKKNKQLFMNVLESIGGMSEEDIAETLGESRKPWGNKKTNKNETKSSQGNSGQEPHEKFVFKSSFLFERPDLLEIVNPTLNNETGQFISPILKGETEDERINKLPSINSIISGEIKDIKEGDRNFGLPLVQKAFNYLYDNFKGMNNLQKLEDNPLFDSSLTQTVIYFQKQSNFTPTGIIDGKLLMELDMALLRKENSKLIIDIDSKYSNSPDNISIKQALNYLYNHILPGLNDSLPLIKNYDLVTKNVIKDLQTQNPEIQRNDGIIDGRTLKILDKLLLEKQSKDFGPLIKEASTSFTKSSHFGDDSDAYLDSNYWEKIGFISFQTKVDVSPSEAMDAVFSKKSTLDCRAAIDVAVLQAARKYLSDEVFDHTYKRKKAEDPGLVITASRKKEFTEKSALGAMNYNISAKGFDDLIIGDWIDYTNDPKYPSGAFRRENLIYLGKDAQGIFRFSGHGLGSNLSTYDIYIAMRKAYLTATREFTGAPKKIAKKNIVEVKKLLEIENKPIGGNDVPENDSKFHPRGFTWDEVSRVAIMFLENIKIKNE